MSREATGDQRQGYARRGSWLRAASHGMEDLDRFLVENSI